MIYGEGRPPQRTVQQTEGTPEPDKSSPVPTLPNEFEIEVPDRAGVPWSASNGTVGVTIFPGEKENPEASKRLADGRPAHLWKQNMIRAALTPKAYKEQWLIAELNGVFVHINHDHKTGVVAIAIAEERLKS